MNVTTQLGGKVVLVTGGAGGIGAGIAEVLLERGAMVALSDLRMDAVTSTAQHVDPSGDRVLALELDVTDAAAADAAVHATVERFGRIDGLVNNAGLIQMNPAWELDAAAWNRHLEVNVTGSFVCAQAAGRRMKEAGGAIVNVSSNCGKAGYPNMAAYNAAKSAVIGLTRSLSMEWAEHAINVNAVCPGGVDTPMLADVAAWLSPRVGEDADTLLKGMGPAQLGRKITPHEVGHVIAFLLSDDALIVRGQAITIDGGDTPY